jgi:hypothetical protein
LLTNRLIYPISGAKDVGTGDRKQKVCAGFDTLRSGSYTANSSIAIGQVAQLVERGPEKAGVGGSIPSLATILFNNLAPLKKTRKKFRAYHRRTSVRHISLFGVARSNKRATHGFS